MAGVHRTSSVWQRQKHTSSSVSLIITAVDREAQRLYQLLNSHFFWYWTGLKHHSLKCAMMTVVLWIIAFRLPTFPWVKIVMLWIYYKVESGDPQSSSRRFQGLPSNMSNILMFSLLNPSSKYVLWKCGYYNHTFPFFYSCHPLMGSVETSANWAECINKGKGVWSLLNYHVCWALTPPRFKTLIWSSTPFVVPFCFICFRLLCWQNAVWEGKCWNTGYPKG